MGCVGSKRSELLQEELESQKSKGSISSTKRSSFASGRLKYIEVIGDGVGVKEREKNKSNGGSDIRNSWSWDERKEKQWNNPNPRYTHPPKNLEGEYVAAGWPTWLSSVAGEAIRGWIPRRADSFEKLDKIGQGTYSNVYKARDLETGKIVALKKVRFDNLEPESVRFMAREIQVLRRLDHPNIIKLEGLVTSRMSCSLYLVFEYMEHDLAGLASSPGIKFSEPQVKCYLQQILRGLDHCHNRGVLHRDIKGSNLLLDNSGILKIADFGLATFFSQDQRQPLTSRVVTLWYRPPELLLGATEYGVGVDLWSTGCILAELLAGKPIMPGRTEVEQLHKIFKLCGSPSEEYWRKSKLPHATIFKPKQPYKRSIAETFRDFPPSALASLETLLAIEPADRGTAARSLKSEFFTSKPFACDPSILPRYPPSKEFDAKLRDEEARRQRAAGGRVQGGDGRRVSKAMPAPDANAELSASIQKRRLVSHSSVKSQSEKFNARQDDSAVGFRIDPPHVADGSAVFGNFGPVVNSSKGLRKQDEVQSMDFSRPAHRSLNKSSSSIRNPVGGFSNPSITAKNSEPFRQQDSTRQSATFGSVKIEKHEHTEEPGQPEAFHKGENRAQQERPSFNGGQLGHIHFSGPLLHPSSNLEDILGQHERQIQQAVRRSRQYSNGAWPNVSIQNHGPLPVRRRKQSRGEIVELLEAEQGLPALVEKPETEHEI